MFKKVLALVVALVVSCATIYAQYEELPFVAGQPPPEARLGEAWCIYVYPATYKWVEEDVKVRDTLIKMRPIPAEYGQETDDFVCDPAHSVGVPYPAQFAPRDIPIECKPAYEELRVIPARFEPAQMEVEVCPAYVERFWVPAQFSAETKTFVICPERKELRKVQCVDGTNIDCFTVVGAPAQSQNVEVKVLVKDGYVSERPVPAKKEMVTVQKLVEPARAERVSVPAQMGTVRTSVVSQESYVKVSQVPARMGKVTRMTVIKEASIVPEEVPAVWQKQRRQVLETPERPVWRKQLLNQMSQSYVPTPTSDVAASAIVQEYGSVPGAAAFPTSRY